MKPIGGYLELELPSGGESAHPGAQLALKSGRACVRLLTELCRPSRVWVPYYCCDALTEPFVLTGTPVGYYELNENFELTSSLPELLAGERLIYTNYFGLKSEYAKSLERQYGERIWIDNTHAFFYQPQDTRAFQFNSARKFFGVPDGAFLYCPANQTLPPAETWPRNDSYRYEHLFLRHLGRPSDGYSVFQENELRNGGDVARISRFSEFILSHIPFAAAARQRRDNYLRLHEHLRGSNEISKSMTDLRDDDVPFCYPFLPRKPIDRQELWSRNLFIPSFWSECLARADVGFHWEKRLSLQMLPLPVDHRYGPLEMDEIVNIIRSQ